MNTSSVSFYIKTARAFTLIRKYAWLVTIWCQFCPMGTIELIFYKLGKALGLTKKTDEMVTVEHPVLCHSCAKCARVCPIQLRPYRSFNENHMFEDERCIRCYTCVNNCPAGILHKVKVYICGTSRMAEDSARILKEKGFSEENIFYESFL